MLTENLHTDRQPAPRFSARDAHATDSGKRRGYRINVFEVHFHRIVGFFAQLERRGRRDRGNQSVDLLKCGQKIARQQRPHLLRLTVISVIVSRRKSVGSQQNTSLHFRAKAFIARLAIHGGERVRRFGTQPKTHAVEARKVRRGLRRRNYVIGRNRVARVRQRYLVNRASGSPQRVERLLHCGTNFGVKALAEVLFRHSDAQARYRL